ncbi:hypothetical protein AB0K21_21790 [Streptosporangium sp. NPDC049248]|uniref:hypothetical protein n=1 Tax=Streptosporangium sp. NPDC049248 TaxID=3155651 RepID=UPI003438F64F
MSTAETALIIGGFFVVGVAGLVLGYFGAAAKGHTPHDCQWKTIGASPGPQPFTLHTSVLRRCAICSDFTTVTLDGRWKIEQLNAHDPEAGTAVEEAAR